MLPDVDDEHGVLPFHDRASLVRRRFDRDVAGLVAHQRTVKLPLGQRVVSTTGRHQFYTVRIVDGVAMPAFKASGDITSMSKADGYIEIPAQTDIVEKGEMVEVRLF